MLDVVEFRVLTGDVTEIVPIVNGRSLVDLVTSFEQSQHHNPAGGYAGIVPAYFRFGDLGLYYLGLEAEQWPKPGHAWLLGCDCGEVGCWPLEARISLTDETVMWSDFSQPHRDAWNYTDFGPFRFARDQYEAAIRDAVSTISSE